MPHAREFPRMRRTVVPLVCAGNSVVDKLIADGFPRFAAIVGSLDLLTEPAAALRCVQTVRLGWRAFHVVDFPTRKMRTAHIPPFTFFVGGENERAFARAHQYAYSAH